jgi:tetratricopeptide (TPR) repeat protein/tRNA A-37 threonylcarbamoyl transferase component Bud32
MTRDDRLADLLVAWDDALARGRSVTPQEHCRDHPDLLHPFVRLLRQLGHINRVFDAPPADPREEIEQIDAGRYKPVAFHAAGGLGVVAVAEDRELNRTVALKVMQRLAALDPAARRRFQYEAEVTGKLEHPGVAPVYGAGEDPAGRPYYAMRFIRGNTLADAVRDYHAATDDPTARRLEFTRLLRCFASVCQTVAYAHARGVLHRDIKPGNIMLGGYGETLLVDWGLAKEMQGSESGLRSTASGASAVSHSIIETLQAVEQTRTGVAKGTPAYMAPEQARGDWDHVGPAADVYALGATLYAVLTGRSPYTGETAEAVMRAVKAGPPPAVGQVNAAAPKPLAAVCEKAMARTPADRYPSAEAVAADVERWLADEPVTAYRDPFPTRARRWVKRNRTPAAAAASALVVGTVALAVLGVWLNQLNDQLRQKNEDLTGALRDVDTARADAVRGWDEAEKREAKANKAYSRTADVLDAMVSGVTGESLETQVVITPEQRKFLKEVLSYYKEFAAAVGNEQKARDRAAKAAHRVGMIEYRLGRNAEASAAFEQSLREHTALAAAYPDPEYPHNLAVAHNNLGLIYKDQGRWKLAEEHYRKGLAVCERMVTAHPSAKLPRDMAATLHNNLGSWKAAIGDRLAAEREYGVTLGLVQKLNADFPSREIRAALVDAHMNLGLVQTDLGKHAEAEGHLREARTLVEALTAEHPDIAHHRVQLASVKMNSARLMRSLGKESAAEKLHREALSIRERLVADYPSVPEYRADLATQHISLGQLLAVRGRPEAQEYLKTAVTGFSRLAADYPDVLEYRTRLAMAHGNSAACASDLGKPAEARQGYEKCLELRDALSKEYPDIPTCEADAATANNDYASFLKKTGLLRAAETQFRTAIDRLNKLVKDHPENPTFRSQLAQSRSNLGITLNDLTKVEEGEEELRAAMVMKEELVSEYPYIPEYRLHLSDTCVNLGYILDRTKRFPEAEKVYRRGLKLTDDLVTEYPEVSAYLLTSAKHHNGLGLSLMGQQKADPAEKEYRSAIEAMKRLIDLSPDNVEHPTVLAASCCNLGILIRDNGRPKDSFELFQTAIDTLLAVNKKEPDLPQVIFFLRNSYWGRADAYHRLGQYAEAVKDWDKALENAQPRYQMMFRIFKNLSVVHTDAEKAVAEIDLIRDLPLWKPADFFNFARIYAVASTKIGKQKEEHVERAIEMLEKAVEAGFKDAVQLKAEEDLKPLREQKGFQKLVEALEAKPPGREVPPPRGGD